MSVSRRLLGVAGRAVVGLLVPLAIYYGLRAADVGVYAAILVSTLASAVPSIVGLIRNGRVNALSAYFTTMLLGSVVIAALAGSTQFLLAKEAVLTGVTGAWFIASAFTDRPLAYLFSKPLMEGRLHWPADWDGLWATAPRWRRMWRVSSALYGLGTMADALLRIVFAYTLPPDVVPALATGLIAVTTVALIVVTNVLYAVSGVFNRASPLYERFPAADPATG
ncbi:VC0807 family protein [Nakamurella sp. GG22]